MGTVIFSNYLWVQARHGGVLFTTLCVGPGPARLSTQASAEIYFHFHTIFGSSYGQSFEYIEDAYFYRPSQWKCSTMRARSYFHPPLPVYDVGTTTVARRLFIGKRPPRRCLQLGCFMGLFRDTRPLKARPRTTTLLVLHRLSLITQISTM